jgi:hypothetical protein
MRPARLFVREEAANLAERSETARPAALVGRQSAFPRADPAPPPRSSIQSAAERDQLRSVMVSERNFPRLAVDCSVGIGIVGLVDNPDTSHDTFPSTNARAI